MFAYNPTVNDRSGEILGAGQMNAAQINARAMVGLGENIGESLKSIGGSFGGAMKAKADGESAYSALQAMGQMYPAIGKITGALDQLDPRTRGMAAQQVLGNFGALSQFGIAAINNSTRQQAPYVNAGLRNAADVAAGNQTYTGGGGMAPVEPPLPVADEPLPSVGGVAPTTAPVSAVPGGQASLDALNESRRRRGLKPIR